MTGLEILKGKCMISSLKASSFLVVGLAGFGNSVLGNSLGPVKNHLFQILNKTPRHVLTMKRSSPIHCKPFSPFYYDLCFIYWSLYSFPEWLCCHLIQSPVLSSLYIASCISEGYLSGNWKTFVGKQWCTIAIPFRNQLLLWGTMAPLYCSFGNWDAPVLC